MESCRHWRVLGRLALWLITQAAFPAGPQGEAVGPPPDVCIGGQRVVAQVDAWAPDVRAALNKGARVHH